jgi:hypothetical protein
MCPDCFQLGGAYTLAPLYLEKIHAPLQGRRDEFR